MLEDRYYMRQATFDTRRSITLLLIIINVAVYLMQFVVAQSSSFPTNYYFALSLNGLRQGYVWQLLTYQFMHAGLLHLVLNCWAIFIFGREVEQVLNRGKFVALYFSSGIIGGLLQTGAALLLGGQFAGSVVGASAAAFGLVAAFAMIYPERQLTLLVFFIIPVSMRAKFLLLFSGLLAVGGIIFGTRSSTDNVAHAAHLGGILTGIVFIRYAMHWNWHWPQLHRARGQSSRPLVKVRSEKSSAWGRVREEDPMEDLPPDEFFSKEVDPILDKISACGIQSLTDRERKILEAARTKMPKR